MTEKLHDPSSCHQCHSVSHNTVTLTLPFVPEGHYRGRHASGGRVVCARHSWIYVEREQWYRCDLCWGFMPGSLYQEFVKVLMARRALEEAQQTYREVAAG